jgi:hypothetical protein
MQDVLVQLLNGNFNSDASENNIEVAQSFPFDFEQDLEQWAAENMGAVSPIGGDGSPLRATPAPTTPSLVQDSNASTTAMTEDEEGPEVICYGMVSQPGFDTAANRRRR